MEQPNILENLRDEVGITLTALGENEQARETILDLVVRELWGGESQLVRFDSPGGNVVYKIRTP